MDSLLLLGWQALEPLLFFKRIREVRGGWPSFCNEKR